MALNNDRFENLAFARIASKWISHYSKIMPKMENKFLIEGIEIILFDLFKKIRMRVF